MVPSLRVGRSVAGAASVGVTENLGMGFAVALDLDIPSPRLGSPLPRGV